MLSDRKKLHIISFSSLAVLLIALFLTKQNSAPVCAALTAISAALLIIFVKKRAVYSHNKFQVTALLAIMGVLCVVLLFFGGIFFGIVFPKYDLSAATVFLKILPAAVAIIASEMIRAVMLAQENKVSTVVSYFICLVSEVLLFSGIPQITSFSIFMELMGMVFLPSIISNLLYHYLARRYGIYPNIAYRLIIGLYAYVIPVLTGIPSSIYSLVKLFIPILIYLFIDSLYEKKKRYALTRKDIVTYIFSGITIVIAILIAMLISCRFHFGLLVVGSPSMENEINMGDAVIYEEYDGKSDLDGAVIVFEKDNSTYIHRVVKTEIINNEIRYTTKGDANEDNDAGYITNANVVGVLKAKIPLIGYPTIWLRELFSR